MRIQADGDDISTVYGFWGTNMKRFSVLAAAFLMSLTLDCSAAYYSDINNLSWKGAEVYINSVTELGLMSGDTNSSGQRVFRAEDSVTYCETAQIIYNMMKKLGCADVPAGNGVVNWEDILYQYGVPEWAEESILFCLKKGIILQREMPHFMTGGEPDAASRQVAAVFYGRAVELTGRLGRAGDSPVTAYNDTQNIDYFNAPYISYLSELRILTGDDKGNFNPDSGISRAEIAAITSRAYNKLANVKEEGGQQTATGTEYNIDSSIGAGNK